MVEAYRETFEKEVGGLRHWAAAPVPVLLRPFEFDEWARGAAALALEQWTGTGAAAQCRRPPTSSSKTSR